MSTTESTHEVAEKTKESRDGKVVRERVTRNGTGGHVSGHSGRKEHEADEEGAPTQIQPDGR